MKKLWIVIVAVMACALFFGACSTPAETPAAATEEAAAEPAAETATEAAAEPATEAATTDAAEGKKLTKMGLVHYDQSYEMYQVMEVSLKEECERDGVELVTADSKVDAMKQQQQIETMLNSGVEAIACITVDGQVLEDVAKACADKGVAFLAQFTPVEGATINMYVDEFDYGYNIGTIAAEYYNKNLPGEENIEVALLRMHDYEPGIERGKGMEAALADLLPAATVVNDQHSNDLESAINATEAILAANPDTVCFLADSDDTGAIGCYEVLMSKVAPEDQDRYCVVGADGVPKAFEYIKEGGMYRGTVALNNTQIGKDVYAALKAAYEGDPYETEMFVAYENVDYDLATAEY